VNKIVKKTEIIDGIHYIVLKVENALDLFIKI